MASHKLALLLFCLVGVVSTILVSTTNAANPNPIVLFNNTAFPANFIFGAGIAAYQAEGAVGPAFGKGQSIWDTFTHNHPEKISNQSTGDVAIDFYHLYKSDIQLMKKIGLHSFRFSLSWTRILPTGKVSGGTNPLGVKFYNDLINELLANGLIPFVTLYHWDLPQALEDEYGGLLSRKFVNDYRDYVNVAFELFGDRVKHWVTFNEPEVLTVYGYAYGIHAPGRCSDFDGTCAAGNSGTEPYLAGHYLLLGHAAAVKLYRDKYQTRQKGEIGITLATNWYISIDDKPANQKAALRVLDFSLGWFADPITYGEYPASMRSLVGNRLPKFRKEESKTLKGSYDFIGINYYSASYVEHNPVVNNVNLSYVTDSQATITMTKNGVPIGTPTDLSWLYIYPQGIRELVHYVKKTYQNPAIYINENGLGNASLPTEDALNDSLRITYISGHLKYLAQAIREGVNVKGYYYWSYADVMEWATGYTVGFGLIHIDFKDGLKRYLKDSAYWYKNFLKAEAAAHSSS